MLHDLVSWVLLGYKVFGHWNRAVQPYAVQDIRCRPDAAYCCPQTAASIHLHVPLQHHYSCQQQHLTILVSVLFSCNCLQLLWSRPLHPYHRCCPGTYLILLVDLHATSGDPQQPASSAVDDEDHGPVPTEEAKHPYLFTRESRSKLTRDKVAPDYAAVLTICSRYLWVTPIQLHAEVAQLEHEMVEVEASASSN